MTKIFVSYSRSDGGDFADHISQHYQKEGNDVFIDQEDIVAGEEWSEKIKRSISNSNIIIVVVTRAALKSLEVEKEVMESIEQRKRIIPARYKGVSWNDLKWDLNKIHGIEFENKNSLIRSLDEVIFKKKDPRQPQHIKDNRKLYFIFFGAIVSIILILIFLNSIQDDKPKNDGKQLSPIPITSEISFIDSWGVKGNDTGQFDYPSGIDIDSSGNVYVVDSNNKRVQKFFKTGENIEEFGKEGSNGERFKNPLGIEVDSLGNVYVSDVEANTIQQFTIDGQYKREIGTTGSGNGQFNDPSGIDIDKDGNVYVVDRQNDRIQKLTKDGEYIQEWGITGNGKGQFDYPIGISIDYLGYVYISDTNNHRIQKFTNNGQYITEWGTKGTDKGRFDYPTGIAVDNLGFIYVSDSKNNRVQKFTNNGQYITEWGTKGTENGQFDFPAGIDIDSEGNIYVVDRSNARIQKFSEVKN